MDSWASCARGLTAFICVDIFSPSALNSEDEKLPDFEKEKKSGNTSRLDVLPDAEHCFL